MHLSRLLHNCVLIALCTNAVIGHAASLNDFGHRHRTINGNLPLGTRPLLVIIADFAGDPPLAFSRDFYDSTVFDQQNSKGVYGYFFQNSNGRFLWSRAVSGTNAGTIGPVPFTEEERNQIRLDDAAGITRVVAKAAALSGFNFDPFDSNHDGKVTGDELAILIINNDADSDGATRAIDPSGCMTPPGSNVKLCYESRRDHDDGAVSTAFYTAGFELTVHELSHSLRTIDLYGDACPSERVTLMSCTPVTSWTWNERRLFNLDPWHKMQLGWCEPRIYSLTAGGFARIPAAQMLDPKAPVILYDPARGTDEFFMLEYRTSTSPNGPGYDANVADNGLALWRVQQDGNHDARVVPDINAGPLPAQPLWRFCNKCNGLHYITNAKSPSFGQCPKGGTHVIDGSKGYQVVMNNANALGQHDWRWCSRCQGMFYGPNQASSRCPVGGTHDGSASGNYSFVQNDSATPGQQHWRWCRKCQGLFYGGTFQFEDETFEVLEAGVCPVSGQHDGSLSGNYAVLIHFDTYAVWTEGPPGPGPKFGRGSSTLWHGGDITPPLRWSDGSQTPVRLYVQPFTAGAETITVEWWAEYDTWVDFKWNGCESGSFSCPFNTLGEGLNAVSYGGHLHIKSGTTPETAHITKRMTIDAFGGPVTLGR